MILSRPFYRVAILAMLTVSFATPGRLHAHGETLLRIAAVTRQIESGITNVAPLYLERGNLHREHQDWTAAEADYAHAAKLAPDLAAVKLCQAALLMDTDHWEAAEALFTKVIVQSPREGEAFIGRARALLKLQRRQAAVKDFQRGLELLPTPPPEYFLKLAEALAAEANSAEALRTLDDGIRRLGPLVPLLGYALQLELEGNHLEAALHRVDKILEIVPRKESWHSQRGDILVLEHRPTEAQQSFKAALRAIDNLPPRLQQSPAVLQLIAHVRESLVKINDRPVVTNLE